jgi:AraC family transcriptional regulator
VDKEISSLSTIRGILDTFIKRLSESSLQDIKLNLLDDAELLEAVDALTMPEQKEAIYVGVWPLETGTYDPALNEIGIPDDAAIFGLFDDSYSKYSAPENIFGLTAVSTLAELKLGCWCAVTVGDFGYVIAITNNPASLEVKMDAFSQQKVSWTEKCRIYHIPDCKMVSSGDGLFGDENFTLFEKWMSKQTVFTIYPFDFLREGDEPEKMNWMYVYDERIEVPKELEIIDFKGGYYAVVTDIDTKGNQGAVQARDEYLKKHNLVIDKSRPEMGHILTGYPLIKETLAAVRWIIGHP